jgi:hypothetical protein
LYRSIERCDVIVGALSCFLVHFQWFWLRDAGDARSHAAWERMAGRPMAEFVENQGRLVAYLLDLADEARGLLEAVVSKQ